MFEIHRPSLPRRIRNNIGKWVYNKNISFCNVERKKEYNFRLINDRRPAGCSVMLRAKNEEDVIITTLRSIYEIFEEIVFIDNGSTDKTLDLVRNFKDSIDEIDKIRILEYPFQVARCGDDHANTDPNSLSSLVYYYNWCLSKLNYNYVIKWDADMYFRKESKKMFIQSLKEIQKHEVILDIPVQTVYLNTEGCTYKAVDEINYDNRVFPNRPYLRYIKGNLWEKLHMDVYIPNVPYSSIVAYEIKDVRKDEFSHWSSTEFKSERKKKEYENFNRVKNGVLDNGFQRVNIF